LAEAWEETKTKLLHNNKEGAVFMVNPVWRMLTFETRWNIFASNVWRIHSWL